MIEIRTIRKTGTKDKYLLVIDGREVSEDDCRIYNRDELLYISVGRFEIYESMFSYSLSHVLFAGVVPQDIELHVIDIDFDFKDPTSGLVLRRSGVSNYEVGFELDFDSEDWNQVWSVQEYARAIQKVIEADTEHTIRWQQSDPETLFNGYIIYFSVTNPEANLDDVVAGFSPTVEAIQEQAFVTLASKFRAVNQEASEDTVVMSFDFPKEVRTPCEQYLLYFVQFLKDLGVDSSADLKHEAGQVLFSVTPDNKEEALDKVREALAVYLQLPTSPMIGAMTFGVGDMHIQQLSANIQHLKGQLLLASAVLQAKDATIQAQQQLINQQQQFQSGEIIPASVRPPTPQKDVSSREELLGGMVVVTKYEGRGFEVNLAEVFRRLRDLFAEKD